MGYYMQEIVNVCQRDGCKKDARYRVYGPRNDRFGDYCREHATAKVTAMERYEQANDYANRKGSR